MRLQGKISILAAIPLAFVIFLSTAFANICLCGQICTHSLQSSSRVNNFPIHLRCVNDLCKSCDLENGQTFKAPNASAYSIGLENIEFWIIPSPFQTLFRHNATQSHFHFKKPFAAGQFSPIYLQNLTIIR